MHITGRIIRKIAGIYPAGEYDVTANRFWSREDRKAARLGAVIIKYQQPVVATVQRNTMDYWLINGCAPPPSLIQRWMADAQAVEFARR